MVWICAPTTFPCSAWSMLCEETLVIWSAFTVATELARLRFEMPVAWPVTTTCSSWRTSFLRITRTVLWPAGTDTSAGE